MGGAMLGREGTGIPQCPAFGGASAARIHARNDRWQAVFSVASALVTQCATSTDWIGRNRLDSERERPSGAEPDCR